MEVLTLFLHYYRRMLGGTSHIYTIHIILTPGRSDRLALLTLFVFVAYSHLHNLSF